MTDDTDYVQGIYDRGEELPPGVYRITRPITRLGGGGGYGPGGGGAMGGNGSPPQGFGAGGGGGSVSVTIEHSGMGVCSKGRRHAPPCDYGNGV